MIHYMRSAETVRDRSEYPNKPLQNNSATPGPAIKPQGSRFCRHRRSANERPTCSAYLLMQAYDCVLVPRPPWQQTQPTALCGRLNHQQLLSTGLWCLFQLRDTRHCSQVSVVDTHQQHDCHTRPSVRGLILRGAPCEQVCCNRLATGKNGMWAGWAVMVYGIPRGAAHTLIRGSANACDAPWVQPKPLYVGTQHTVKQHSPTVRTERWPAGPMWDVNTCRSLFDMRSWVLSTGCCHKLWQ